jgi:hypothetical protein
MEADVMEPDDRVPPDARRVDDARREASGPPRPDQRQGASSVHPIDGRRREWTLASHLREPPRDLR